MASKEATARSKINKLLEVAGWRFFADGKEQTRKYVRSQNCRFIILSYGDLHYIWDLERGNHYPRQASLRDGLTAL